MASSDVWETVFTLVVNSIKLIKTTEIIPVNGKQDEQTKISIVLTSNITTGQ